MEKMEDVFGEYNLGNGRCYRGRKMLMYETVDKQLFGVMPTARTENRLVKEYLAKKYLQMQGFSNTDQLLQNQFGNFITEDKYHSCFVVEQFFEGRELNINDIKEVAIGAGNLAELHMAAEGMKTWMSENEAIYWENKEVLEKERLKKLQEQGNIAEGKSKYMDSQGNTLYDVERENGLHQEKEERKCGNKLVNVDTVQFSYYDWLAKGMDKRNREMKRIMTYMKKPGRKGLFVNLYTDCANAFMNEGKEARNLLEQPESKELLGKSMITEEFCHGNYQHHNVLWTGKLWATIGMERFYFGCQLQDLHDYLRKVMEKNNYNMSFCEAVIHEYSQKKPLLKQECLALYVLFCYPDKFWKVANRYFNSKKTWVPPKMVEKLQNVVKQNVEKKKFLVKFREDYVD